MGWSAAHGINMNQLGILFAGQGSQSPTMGLSFTSHPSFQSALPILEKLLGYNVMTLIASNDGRLNQTLFTQPSIFSISTLMWQVIESTFQPRVQATCGFSLGEYAALAASGALTLESLTRLIQVRAQAMHQASVQQPGKMAAILGLEELVITEICREASTDEQLVVAANINSPGQIVISGHAEAIERAIQLANSKGARRAVVLNVSGAFHSPFMASAQVALKTALDNENVQQPRLSIYMNVDGLIGNQQFIKSNMVDQLVKPVQFERSIRNMVRDGITHFLEIGPGTVLQGLVKKIVPEIPVISFNELADMDVLKGWLQQYGFIQ